MRILLAILLFNSTLYAQISANKFSIGGNLKVIIGKETVIPGKLVALQLSRIETSIDSSEYNIKGLTIKKVSKTKVNTIDYRTTTDSLGNFEFNALKKGSYTLYLDQDINFSGIILPEQVIQLDNKSVGNLNLTGTLNCEMNNDLAILHIKEHKPGLVLIGGIAPVIYESDQKFEKKFAVEYIIFGCEVPPNECIASYNETIFKFLDQKYGKKWRKTVRKDVVGLK